MTNDLEFISILMATHRVDKYLPLAIESILNQTHKNFEFIIIANGPNCIFIKNFIEKKYNDHRIKILTSKIPQLAHALNIGIDASKYSLLGRMDADDISHPSRIEKQISYMKTKNLDILGCDINLIDTQNQSIGQRIYPKGKDIYKKIYIKNPFAHNTIIYKKDTLIKLRGYNSGLNTEDYDLWLRAKRQNIKMDNISEFLLDYRIHSESTQGNKLGYAEASGYILREFLLKPSFNSFFAIPLNIAKYFLKGK